MPLRLDIAGLVACLAAGLAGCGEPPPPDATPSGTPAPPPTMAWQDGGIEVPPAAVDALEGAIAEARAAAPRARGRWASADPDLRRWWAVKWAAATIDGGVEHVWVMPVTSWTGHRVEGILASTPHRPLLCGREPGESVSLPAEELTDWVHFLEGDLDGRREGGFTIGALVERFGEP